jgi:hypothetical protein
MKQVLNLSILFICILCFSCVHKANITETGNLVKVNITDTCIKGILTEYIKSYPFDGKGIYLVNVRNFNDSVKYYVGMAFTEQQITTVLREIPYYFYDIVNQRAVIVTTKLEKFIEPQNCVFDSDTVFQRFYDESLINRDVYFMEFTKTAGKVDSKVIYFDPFF